MRGATGEGIHGAPKLASSRSFVNAFMHFSHFSLINVHWQNFFPTL